MTDMSTPDKSVADTVQSIRWPVDDWERIEEACGLVLDRDHLDLGRADFIRFATRRMVEHVLQGGSVAAPVEP